MEIKYHENWSGIDSGREGLWREPTWSGVLTIIAAHECEEVYNHEAHIYAALEKSFPKEKWRSYTREGQFRPLFRDYPSPWTRTGVVSLGGQKFNVTALGQDALKGRISKQQLLLSMFGKHTSAGERPFAILAQALLAAPRPLSTNEMYWYVMKNWRPGKDKLLEIIKKPLPRETEKTPVTPIRRLRNILTLLRAAGALQTHLRRGETWWAIGDIDLLKQIAEAK
jgi:hypothetical protein